jgi:hypothetical protein
MSVADVPSRFSSSFTSRNTPCALRFARRSLRVGQHNKDSTYIEASANFLWIAMTALGQFIPTDRLLLADRSPLQGLLSRALKVRRWSSGLRLRAILKSCAMHT